MRANHEARAVVDSDIEAPDRCIEGVIFDLQRVGLRVMAVTVNVVPILHSLNTRNGWEADNPVASQIGNVCCVWVTAERAAAVSFSAAKPFGCLQKERR